MASPQCCIQKFKLNEPAQKSAIIRTNWHEHQIEFTIIVVDTDTPTAYQTPDEYAGVLTMSKLKEMAEALEKSPEDMISEIKSAFCRADANDKFLFEFCKGNFAWYKKSIDGLKLKYGSIALDVKYNLSFHLLMDLMTIHADLAQKYDECSTTLRQTKINLLESETLLQQTIDEKLSGETNALIKFNALLNEKKMKINQLEHLMKNAKATPKNLLNTKDDFAIDRNANKRAFVPDEGESESVTVTASVKGNSMLDGASADSTTRIGPPKRQKRIRNNKTVTAPASSTSDPHFGQKAKDNLNSAVAEPVEKEKTAEKTIETKSQNIYEADTEAESEEIFNRM